MQKQINLQISLLPNKKLYFLSDIHLGSPNEESSLQREKKLVQFLDNIKQNAQAIFFVGDIFDFWFEYKHAVPKYYIRFFAKIIELREQQIDVYFIKGNHDLWMGNYLENMLNVQLIEDKIYLDCMSKKFFITHGDGKGPNDIKYKILKKIFTNKICQFLFSYLHPDIGIKIAQTWSRSSFTNPKVEFFKGEDKEWLIQYAKKKMAEQYFDFFIFGHRHLPMQLNLEQKTTYTNLGDWIANFTYAIFDGQQLILNNVESEI
jgi:UDP-2,3-diacylglucosamine hydrolase